VEKKLHIRRDLLYNNIMDQKSLILDGNSLTVEDLYAYITNPRTQIKIRQECFVKINRSRLFLEKEMGSRVIYGVNTGFGPMSSHIIGQTELEELQKNLIVSHAVGMGEPLDQVLVLSTMVVRLNTILKGYSGVSRKLVERLKFFIDNRIIPVMPEHGAVGTSGDLVHLAHIALAIIGGGEVFYKNKKYKTKNLFEKLKIENYNLKPKEGLSLINGTAMMTGVAAILCVKAERLFNLAVRTGALALELVNAFEDSFSKELQRVRPHQGQIEVASALRNLLSTSKLLNQRESWQKTILIPTDGVKDINKDVQEIYSFRCLPQILGPILDSLRKTQKDVGTEINSVTDNPIIDVRHKNILHGGNFHGDYISSSLDQLKIGLVKLTLLSERRINFFLNQNVNKQFPPFMNLAKPGLTLGLQGLQFVATSTAAQSQSLAYPHSLHSISTNADNQDVVSMGSDAALLTAKVVDNGFILLTIETITLLQAVDFLKIYPKLSQSSKKLYTALRKLFPKIVEDKVITEKLRKVKNFIEYSLEKEDLSKA